MAGYEFMGELPFRNVYFTGIIRDKQGRKMSKSLGNSPDPLALIDEYGADALRFGTMRSAPLGQDVLFDEKDVELGRNFCNKLWNACRFRQMQPGEAAPMDSRYLTNDDKWILLKLNLAIREITEAFEGYRFNEAAQVLYRFFWSEYCDWYIEASKAILSAGARPAESNASPPAVPPTAGAANARRANTLAVIDFVLSHTLRLFHPFLPFITEELWHGMGFSKTTPQGRGRETIMFTEWPKPFDRDFRDQYGLDDCYLDFTNDRNELITQGRNLRREAKIPAGKKVKFIFKPTQGLPPHEVEVFRLLLNAETFEVSSEVEVKKGTPAVRTDLGELFMPLEGLVDLGAEETRVKKEIEKLDAEITKAQERLLNPAFSQRAPAAVLAEHQKRLADFQSRREQLTASLAALKD